MKKFLTLIFLTFVLFTLSATKVVLIIDPPYSDEAIENNFSHYIMNKIMEKLELNAEYEYATHANAMQMIDDNIDAVFFPYKKPRQMSNRILLSDTLYTASHTVFYDSRVLDNLEVNSFTDLKEYVVGSHGYYSREIDLRRAGLTVHYSNNNTESMQKMLAGDLAVVTEDRIQGLMIIKDLDDENKSFIKYLDIQLFPEPLFVIAPVNNEDAAAVIYRINELIQEEEFIKAVTDEFYLMGG